MVIAERECVSCSVLGAVSSPYKMRSGVANNDLDMRRAHWGSRLRPRPPAPTPPSSYLCRQPRM